MRPAACLPAPSRIQRSPRRLVERRPVPEGDPPPPFPAGVLFVLPAVHFDIQSLAIVVLLWSYLSFLSFTFAARSPSLLLAPGLAAAIHADYLWGESADEIHKVSLKGNDGFNVLVGRGRLI